MEEPNATDSLVIAATNHVEILDKALARRFDEVIEYGPPDADAARSLLSRRLGKFKLTAKAWAHVAPLAEGLSQGELVRAADMVVKDAILEGAKSASADRLVQAFEDRQAFRQRFHR